MKQQTIAILGGGINGCIAALYAKQQGFLPVLIENRTYLGFEMTAKHQTYLSDESWNTLQESSLLHLYGNGIQVKDEICFYQGEIKTNLMQQIQDAGIPCFFLTQAVGVTGTNEVNGIVVANAFGTYYLPASAVIDCTGDGILQNMFGSGIEQQSGILHFCSEIEGEHLPFTTISVPNIKNAVLQLHHSKKGENTAIADISFPYKPRQTLPFTRTIMEHDARKAAVEILSSLSSMAEFADKNLKLIQIASEAAFAVEALQPASFPIQNIFEAPKLSFEFGCEDIMHSQNALQNLIKKLTANLQSTSLPDTLPMQAQIGGRSIGICLSNKQPITWMNTSLQAIEIDNSQLPIIETSILIAGLGVSGMAAMAGAIDGEKSLLGIESQSDLGGTQTMGRVMGYYYGHQGGPAHDILEKTNAFATDILQIKCPPAARHIPRILYYHHFIKENNIPFLLHTVLCGAEVDKQTNALTGVMIGNEQGLFRIKLEMAIDSTGNADLAALAGVAFEFGDADDRNSQTFSMWGNDIHPPQDYRQRQYSGDFDAVDTTSYADMMRAVTVSQLNNSPYYISNPLSYREGRRIIGRDYLTIERTMTFQDVKDIVIIGESTLDNHGRTSAAFARMGFAALERVYRAAVSWRCYIPKHLNGLLVSGKNISADRDAIGLIRMNADSINAGFALGMAAQLMKHPDPERIPFDALRKHLYEKKILTDERSTPSIPNAETALTHLLAGETFGLFEVMLQKKATIIPMLKQSFASETNINASIRLELAKALAWFGDHSVSDLLRKRMAYLMEHESKDATSDIDERMNVVNHGIQGERNDYWELNQHIELAAKLQDRTSIPLLCKLVNKAHAGGEPYFSHIPYYASRLDMVRVPFFERLFNLAHAFMEMPDQAAVVPLESLLRKPNIGGENFTYDCYKVPLYFTSYLEMSIARAAYRCGSKKAEALLKKYAADIRTTLSDTARKELNL